MNLCAFCSTASSKLIIDLYLVSLMSSDVEPFKWGANFGFLFCVVLLGGEDCLNHCLCLGLSEEG